LLLPPAELYDYYRPTRLSRLSLSLSLFRFLLDHEALWPGQRIHSLSHTMLPTIDPQRLKAAGQHPAVFVV
jgi:hypothetical protein